MRKKLFITFLFGLFMQSSAIADPVTGIEVLEMNPSKDAMILKLHSADRAPKGSFFFVKLEKSDPDYEKKLELVQEKSDKKDQMQLALDIVSFSAVPNGATYRSKYVKFYEKK